MKGVQVGLFRIIHLNLTFCCYVLTPAKFHRRLRHHAKNFFDNCATKGFISFIFNHETPLENRNMPQTVVRNTWYLDWWCILEGVSKTMKWVVLFMDSFGGRLCIGHGTSLRLTSSDARRDGWTGAHGRVLSQPAYGGVWKQKKTLEELSTIEKKSPGKTISSEVFALMTM